MRKSLYPSIYIFFFLIQTYSFTLEPFDWSSILTVPPTSKAQKGNQILHFKQSNKPYEESSEATEFVNKYLKEAREFTSDAEVLKYAVEHTTLVGLYIELGVCTGKTINFIAALKPYETIYGFDSFEGLPEDWVRGDKIFKAGTFGFRDTTFLPPTLHNVTLIKGWFETTIPSFIADQNPKKPVAFLHVDSDLYSSAHFALKTLQEYIQIGTIIVFDELYNYPGFENHEWKALEEFLAFTGFQIKFLAFNSNHQQVAIEIISLQ